MDDVLASEAYCHVTTRGRRTGRAHRIEIWFAAAPGTDRIYLLAGGRERADWVRNLRADPSVHVVIGRRQFSGIARVVEGTAEDALARRLVYDKYREQDDLDEWRDTALPVAIDLQAAVVP